MKKYKAFSLVELSVVLLVIALMSVGVLQGTSSIKQARIANARSVTSSSPVPTIEGLVAWYEPTLIKSFKTNEIANDAQITAWYDISPGSVVAKKNTLVTASTGVLMSSQGINKLPSIYFNGTSRLSISEFYQGTTAQNTIFFVARPYTVTSGDSIVFDTGSGSAWCVFALTIGRFYFDCSTLASPSYTFEIGKEYIISAYRNGTSSRIYSNDATNMVGGSFINSGNNLLYGISVGADRNSEHGFTGLISEVIVFNRTLNLQERKDIMRYLSKKYAIEVANL